MTRKPIALVALAAAALAGCGSSSSDKAAPKGPVGSSKGGADTGATNAGDRSYDPKIDPAKFTDKITNPYLQFKPGTKWVYTGVKNGAPQRVEVAVTKQTKTVLGVRCVVVSDVVTVNSSLAEKTTDWYAQDSKGNVWYFGEDTKEYQNGAVTSTQGTWEAGVDNAKPGIVMFANPKPGGFYRQEYRPGIAEDKARILTATGTQKVPAGTFRNVVQTRDIDPLNPDKMENKWYARGVGVVHVLRIRGKNQTEEIKLVSKS